MAKNKVAPVFPGHGVYTFNVFSRLVSYLLSALWTALFWRAYRLVLRHHYRHSVVRDCDDVVYAQHPPQRLRRLPSTSFCQVHLLQAARSRSLSQNSFAARTSHQPSQCLVSVVISRWRNGCYFSGVCAAVRVCLRKSQNLDDIGF